MGHTSDGARILVPLRAIALFGFLLAVYFVTYHGQPYSTDELFLFDSARSFAHSGGTELAYTSDLLNYSTQAPGVIVPSYGITYPVPLYVSAIFIRIAERLPGIGIMQLTWLLNVIVTALTGVIVFGYGVLLGYRQRTALLGAILFGMGTFVWSYSQMYFREPLLMLMAIAAAYAVERARRSHQITVGMAWLAAAALAYIGAINTKDSGYFILPVLLIIVFPRSWREPLRKSKPRYRIIALVVGLLIVGAVAAFGLSRSSSALARLNNFQYTGDAIAAYLFSPGFSIWALSPVLLLGIYGAYRLVRQRRYRQFLVPLVMLITFVLVHAILSSTFWYGGLGWGPRFLEPITPFLCLWLLPVIEQLSVLRRPARFVILGVVALSIALQILATASPVIGFSDYLDSESKRLGQEIVPWREGVWNLRYIPQVVQLRRVGDAPSPLAWIQNSGAWMVVLPLCALVLAFNGTVILGKIRPRRVWQSAAVAVVLMGSAALMFAGGLLTYNRDPRYGGNDPSLVTVLNTLKTQSAPGDVILLGNLTYRLFFMNYDKLSLPIYVLPQSEGERLQPDKQPYVVSNLSEERANPYFQEMLARLAPISKRWWFLTEYNPFDSTRFRVTENYLVRHYFPLTEVLSEPRARLLQFAPISAPADMVPPWPATPVGADFGAATLVGVDLPRGTSFKRGEVLPVSLLWQRGDWPKDLEVLDYSINVSLIDQSGTTRAQRSAQPLSGFGKFTLWTPGGFYRDNHALALPADLPAGQYELWVLVFDWRANGKNLPIRNQTGKPEHVVVAHIQVGP